jgi:hypothetical protein
MNDNIEQAVRNAVASAEMEGLYPTEEDIARIIDFVEHKITKDELISIIFADIEGHDL